METTLLMVRWESHIPQHLLPSVLNILVPQPIHPAILWTRTMQKASVLQKGETQSASIQKKRSQIPGMEKT